MKEEITVAELIEKLEQLDSTSVVIDYDGEPINCVYEDNMGHVIIEHEY